MAGPCRQNNHRRCRTLVRSRLCPPRRGKCRHRRRRFGGATAARYIKQRNPAINVTLVEPSTTYYTCPFTNLHFGGLRTFEQQGHGFDDLRAAGINVIHDYAADVDTASKKVSLSGGDSLDYDKLLLSPGINIR